MKHFVQSIGRLLVVGWLACSSFAAEGQVTTHIDLNRRAQTLEGWGVSLCWWANMCGRWGDGPALDSLLTWLCSPDHLGYSLFRYNIGGGDDPDWTHCSPHHCGARGGKGLRAEMEGFASAEGVYHWEADAPQRLVMLKLKELRPDAQFEAFSNSPPWWMTESGCAGGAVVATDDNLREDCYEAFARYLVDVCQMYRDSFNLEFLTLEPFNEPMTDYWKAGGGQEGCHFSVEAQLRFLQVLQPLLAASGLSTRLAVSDETSVAQSVADLRAYMADTATLATLWQWNTHSYEATDEDRLLLHSLARQAGLRLWQSETGMGGRGLHGNLQLAQRLISDMRLLQPTAWMDWQYVEERGDQWSLVTCPDWRSNTFARNKNYWVRWHFSHFIRPGFTFIETDNPQLLAARSPEADSLVVVLLNTERRGGVEHTLYINGVKGVHAWRTSWQEEGTACDDFVLEDDHLKVLLPPLSIVTFVVSL